MLCAKSNRFFFASYSFSWLIFHHSEVDKKCKLTQTSIILSHLDCCYNTASYGCWNIQCCTKFLKINNTPGTPKNTISDSRSKKLISYVQLIYSSIPLKSTLFWTNFHGIFNFSQTIHWLHIHEQCPLYQIGRFIGRIIADFTVKIHFLFVAQKNSKRKTFGINDRTD